ncbi:UDP-N-acetylmuramyl pentapeptide phosphotransferase [Thermoanaerobacter mathranii]|uniref:UDP-N-acetylmuramyl pentapeptide phosphotransferase n=1 Tax=Thermoanaerobacter mathranii TaxID=583357 RepID=UPI003AADFCFB
MFWTKILLTPLIMTVITKKLFYSIISKPLCLRENYKKMMIPVCGGIVFVPSLFVSIILLNLLGLKIDYQEVILLSLSLISFAGFIDDVLGDKNVRGLKGHITMFLKGKPTTGSLKALSGVLIAFFTSFNIGKNYIGELIIDTLIIALFTNFLNLVDLRPGRSGKTFLVISLIFLIIGKTQPYFLVLLTMILLVYLPEDLKAKVMMGDTGSNVLGMSLGISSILIFDLYGKLIILTLLILLHIFTEKYSLTALIEKNKVLNYLDMLGRKGER